jgi:hypothetical protein
LYLIILDHVLTTSPHITGGNGGKGGGGAGGLFRFDIELFFCFTIVIISLFEFLFLPCMSSPQTSEKKSFFGHEKQPFQLQQKMLSLQLATQLLYRLDESYHHRVFP